MMDNLFTRGQLERKISQEIQEYYNCNLEHRPSKVTCHLFDAKLAVIIEDSITNAELMLLEQEKSNLAEKVRLYLDRAIRPKLKLLIEEVTQVRVVDILSDATLSTKRTGIIVILDSTPKVRNRQNVFKV